MNARISRQIASLKRDRVITKEQAVLLYTEWDALTSDWNARPYYGIPEHAAFLLETLRDDEWDANALAEQLMPDVFPVVCSQFGRSVAEEATPDGILRVVVVYWRSTRDRVANGASLKSLAITASFRVAFDIIKRERREIERRQNLDAASPRCASSDDDDPVRDEIAMFIDWLITEKATAKQHRVFRYTVEHLGDTSYEIADALDLAAATVRKIQERLRTLVVNSAHRAYAEDKLSAAAYRRILALFAASSRKAIPIEHIVPEDDDEREGDPRGDEESGSGGVRIPVHRGPGPRSGVATVD